MSRINKRAILPIIIAVAFIPMMSCLHTKRISENPVFSDSAANLMDTAEADSLTVAVQALEIPAELEGEIRREHLAYSLSFNLLHQQANWIAYVLTAEETRALVERTNRFKPDPLLSSTVSDADYLHSGFDKGHLAPAADMSWSEEVMTESFYFSNISPQLPGFNRGVWKRLETLVRDWAVEYDSIYVLTGPVLNRSLPTIGEGSISVPSHFYKVILDYSGPQHKGIGFILPNASSSADLREFVVTIDSAESFTQLDFFPSLPDSSEAFLESSVDLLLWKW